MAIESFPLISKFGPFIFWVLAILKILGENSTSKEIASAVWRSTQQVSLTPNCVGRGSYNFIKTVNWSSSVSSSKAILIPVLKLPFPKLIKKSSKKGDASNSFIKEFTAVDIWSLVKVLLANLNSVLSTDISWIK